MSSDEFGSDDDFSPPKKKLSVERIYQKKTQLEHILLRPDTYIGSVEPVTQPMWVFEEDQMVYRDITFVPGLYKIFDEILVNAADNKQRDKNMDCLRIEIDPDQNKVSVYNNGRGIPVVEHKTEKMFVPSLIFGHLLTSSNFNDEEKKVTGGRNGYGAKLCNVFSTKFLVETSSKEFKKSFKQTWNDNMTKSTEAKVVPATGEDFTRITFYPDLTKFKMDYLDKDIVALMSRRAYDVAGSTRGVKVFLNGKRLGIKGFKDYVDHYLKGKEDEMGNPLKCAYESVNDRWEIAVAMSDRGFQQVSFVNSIATTKGGRHVDYVADQVVNKLIEVVKKKNKAGVNVKPFQIKNHLWVFVNCLIENPTFDSQTKENMTLQMKNFGSKCQPSEKFFTSAIKTGVVESILSWIKFKAESQLATKCHAKKHSKLKGIPKLEDANDAGTKNSIDCTLILTEGDSAKSLVVAGLSIVGRDKYGVFPLRGKMLNVREASHKQIMENAEINNIIKILGLQYKKKYDSTDDLRTLRYGKLMIMTDQDQDGSHIKGLLINFLHHNWPSLLKLPFLEEFITPIVKITKGNEVKSFYSLPEFEEWKKETSNWSSWKIKYYKGLGTSTPAEAKEYFQEIHRHRILFKYQGPEDDHFVTLAFSKKMVEQRKDWLTNGMENRKRRRELGLPEIYLYEKDTRSVSYKDFINKELILFSNMDNERSIPSVMDGLKPGQRKVLFTCFKRNDKREVKVAQLAGSVGELSAYHHGEASLMSTIINLAQNFVGSNNINLLQPIGQFGTRLQGGKDAASPRYIFTMLNPLTRKIFDSLDEPLFNYLYDDNLKIEPEYYVPVIPMVLVNGAEGIGTGWSTKIPNYNPREIVKNLRRLIRGEELVPMIPWFKGFSGTIEQLDNQRIVISGECASLDNKSFEITELPIRVWTQTYKESVLESLLHGSEKTPSFITDYKEYHTDTTVRFVVTLSEANLSKALSEGMHKTFKLQTSLTLSSMVLFDHNGCLKRYDSPEEIIQEFFGVRLEYYAKRKSYYEGMLEAEALKLSNQARFILEKNDGTIKMENVGIKEMIRKLIEKGFDSDPVKAWKIKHAKDESDDDESENGGRDEKHDFDYLIDMTMRSMLREKVEELLKRRDAKKAELDKLKASTPEGLWEKDLESFLEEMQKVEDEESQIQKEGKATKLIKGAKGKSKFAKISEDSKPSAFGERIFPKVDPEYYKKATTAGGKKGKPKIKDDLDLETLDDENRKSDDDDVKPLAERIGISPKIIDQKKARVFETKSNDKESKKNDKEPKKKVAKKNGDAKDGKKKITDFFKKKDKRNPWSDSESEEPSIESEMSDEEDDYVPVKTKKRKFEEGDGLSGDEKKSDEKEKVDENAELAHRIDSYFSSVDEQSKSEEKEEKEETKKKTLKKSAPTKKKAENATKKKSENATKKKPENASKKKKAANSKQKKRNPWSDSSPEASEVELSESDDSDVYVPVQSSKRKKLDAFDLSDDDF